MAKEKTKQSLGVVPKSNAKYGWVRGRADRRDLFYSAPHPILTALPAKIDLTETGFFPPIFDQSDIGSCTANAYIAEYLFTSARNHPEAHDFASANLEMLSRLFLYYESRKLEGTVKSDAGAVIRDVFKVAASVGVALESVWPYDISKFTVAPPKKAYKTAKSHQALIYQRVIQTLPQMKSCLAEGYPFVFGFTVYESFDSIGPDGVMPFPKDGEKEEGGHAVLAVGYDDATGRLKIRNSWGETWGDRGHFYMPYSIAADSSFSDDFWTLRQVE